MNNREIVFSDKLLWAGLIGLLVGAYLLGTGEGWLVVVVGTILAALITVSVLAMFLEPVANYLVFRNIDGMPRKLAIAIVVIGSILGLLGWFVFDVIVHSGSVKEFVSRHPYIHGALLVILLWAAIHDSIKRRRERAKMNTVDLSRGRDLTIK
ncbi:MAG: hypothetical protein KGN32_03275 [Burkholderiales bacterium]|nr:hypothetical protein [Burkholderiales bacterium]